MAIDKVREYFRNYGIEERVQEFEVSSATEEINIQMGVPLGRPMFYLSRISYGEGEVPVEYVESVYRADKYIFSAVLTTP